MGDAMEALTRSLDQEHPTAGPVLFTCRHRVYGVGMFDVAAVLEGDAVVARAGAGEHRPTSWSERSRPVMAR